MFGYAPNALLFLRPKEVFLVENGKICTMCNEFKNFDELVKYKKHNGKYGYNSKCKKCENERKKQYDRKNYDNKREKTPERKEYQNKYRKVSKTCESCKSFFIGQKYQERPLCKACIEFKKITARLVKKELEQFRKDKIKQQKFNKKELIKEQKKIARIKECETCGETFEALNKIAKFCSDKCRKKAENRKKEMRKDIRMKKAKVNGRFDSNITLEKLVKRDGLECYLCHHQCDWNDYILSKEGYFFVGKLYPTIEHVIAIDNGGTHSWGNVKVSCHGCNTNKGTKLLENVI